MVAAYFTTANISGIGTVFPSPPKISRSSDAMANVPAGTPSGSVLYVEVLSSSEIRVALGGPVAGKKTVSYNLRLHLLFRSRQLKAEDAMDDHDDQVEAILELLRSDRTLGTTSLSPSPILQNGEGEQGITVQTGMPKETGTGSTILWSIIDSEAVEFITA
jgi:hypothetical protein